MESKIIIHFCKEDKDVEIEIEKPDFSKLVHSIVADNLCVTNENMQMEVVGKDDFDIKEFSDILVEVYAEYVSEIERFYNNIEDEIRTYYSNTELTQHIIDTIKTEQIK